MKTSAAARLVRRQLNRLAGHARWRLKTFDEIMAARPKRPPRGSEPPFQPDGVVLRLRNVGALRRELWQLSPGGAAGNAGIVYEPRSRTAARETVLDWHLPPPRHPLLHAPGFPAAQALPGLSLSAVTLSAEGFWHFLIEALPKIQIAALWRDRIGRILINGPETAWKQRWLDRAGFAAPDIVWMGGLSNYHCEQLLFSPPLVADAEPTPSSVAAVRELLQVPRPVGSAVRKLWASLGDARSRNPCWERAMLSQASDWERIEFSRLTPAETIRLCAEAAALAGPHGANLANAIFLPPGARLIGLFPRGKGNALFSKLARAASLHYDGFELDFDDPGEAIPAASVLRKASAHGPTSPG